MQTKKKPTQTAIRVSTKKKKTPLVLYRKNEELSREICDAVLDSCAVALIINEVAAVYGIGAVAMCGTAVPGWLPTSIAVSAATILGSVTVCAFKLLDKHFDKLPAKKSERRLGTIPADTLCRILKEARR